MAENGEEGGDGGGFEAADGQDACGDGDVAFGGVEEEGCGSEAFGSGADDVGGSDIAAAEGADVFFPEDADEEIAEGDGAEEIGEGRDGEVDRGDDLDG